MRLPETLELQGYWWLPEKPENQLPGTLFISDSVDVKLEVHGLLGKGIVPKSDQVSRIYGIG